MAVVTKILDPCKLDLAVDLLKQGEVVAFPTETVYGLGANALEPGAVQKIFQAKGRPQDNPLIVHCSNTAEIREFVQEIPPGAVALMERFWPGPLTLVLPKKDIVPLVVTAGLNTVGIRVPDHPLALELLKKTGFPLAAPSANLSGRPSPTRAEHVLADLAGKIPAILDGGETGWGLESTVLDCTVKPFCLLRPGGVTVEQLRTLIEVQVSDVLLGGETPRSPGMKYKHYAPRGEVFLVLGNAARKTIQELSGDLLAQGRKVGVMAWDDQAPFYGELVFLGMGPRGDLPILANRLYHLLRESDRRGIEVLFIEGVSAGHLGLAIMNRLQRAAQGRIIWT